MKKMTKIRTFFCSTGFYLFFTLFLANNTYSQAPVFTRSCNDPLVAAHLTKFGHSYCYHVCGFVSDKFSTCDTQTGNCLCHRPCSDDPFTITGPPAASSVCPPYPTDPPDPDPLALPSCIANCSAICPRGLGIICGEIEILGPMRNIYTKVCTCFCPAVPCPPQTAASSTNIQTQISIVKTPLLKFKYIFTKLANFIFKTLVTVLSFIFAVVYKMWFFYFIQCMAISFFYFFLRELLIWEVTQLVQWFSWWFQYIK